MKVRLLCIVMAMFNLSANQKSVFIYNGPGVSPESFKHAEFAVRKMLPQFLIEAVGPAEVIHHFWEERAALFIIPGGADIPYVKELNGVGNQKIKRYVENGGAFLGICAGSYYAGGFVNFGKNTPLEVQGERELAFFPGVVTGPVLAQYDYLSQKGSRAAQLTWSGLDGFADGEKFTVFYNGGGYFEDVVKFSNTKVLAYYDEERKLPAIIQCKIGKGIAILSGAHFEYEPSLLDLEDPYLKGVIPLIFEDNERRQLLLKYLFERLVSSGGDYGSSLF